MIAAAAWSAVVLVVHVGIRQGWVSSVGYNYGSVCVDGEWWRLAVAPLCHVEQNHAVLSAVALVYAGGSSESEWALGVGLALTSVAVEALSLCVIASAITTGASRHELSALPEGERERWLAHGCAPTALAWIARFPPVDGPRPALVAMLFAFAIQLAAPHEPGLPLVAGCALGLVLSASPKLDAAFASKYWTATGLLWCAFLAVASLKATRPLARVPGVSYSHLPAPPLDEDDDDLEDDDPDLTTLGPNGAPVFHVVDPQPYRPRRAPRVPVDWATAPRLALDDDDDDIQLPPRVREEERWPP